MAHLLGGRTTRVALPTPAGADHIHCPLGSFACTPGRHVCQIYASAFSVTLGTYASGHYLPPRFRTCQALLPGVFLPPLTQLDVSVFTAPTACSLLVAPALPRLPARGELLDHPTVRVSDIPRLLPSFWLFYILRLFAFKKPAPFQVFLLSHWRKIRAAATVFFSNCHTLPGALIIVV